MARAEQGDGALHLGTIAPARLATQQMQPGRKAGPQGQCPFKIGGDKFRHVAAG